MPIPLRLDTRFLLPLSVASALSTTYVVSQVDNFSLPGRYTVALSPTHHHLRHLPFLFHLCRLGYPSPQLSVTALFLAPLHYRSRFSLRYSSPRHLRSLMYVACLTLSVSVAVASLCRLSSQYNLRSQLDNLLCCLVSNSTSSPSPSRLFHLRRLGYPSPRLSVTALSLAPLRYRS